MQWYETQRGNDRLALETQLLRIDWPQMALDYGSDGVIRVHGYLYPKGLVSRYYYIVAEFPSDYPYSPPHIWCPYERFPESTPHLFPSSNQRLCIEHDDFCPDDTITDILGWTAQWLALYENFLRTRQRW